MQNRRQFLGNSLLAFTGASLVGCMNNPVVEVAKANSSDDTNPVTVVRFDDSGQSLGKTQVKKVRKTDAEWKRQLTPLQFEVTSQQGTEMAFTGATYNLHEK